MATLPQRQPCTNTAERIYIKESDMKPCVENCKLEHSNAFVTGDDIERVGHLQCEENFTPVDVNLETGWLTDESGAVLITECENGKYNIISV